MSRYVRKDSRAIYLPGHGKIKDDRIIEGDYDKYVPSVLIRLSDELPARIHEAVTEVFPVPQLRAPVTPPAPVVPPAPAAQVVAPPLPDSVVIPPPFVEPEGSDPVVSEPIESNESSDSGVDDKMDKMATRDQAAAVVAKMKKARR